MSWSEKKRCWNAFITFAYVDSNLNKSYYDIFFPNGFAIWEIHTRSINPLRSIWFRSQNYGCLVTCFAIHWQQNQVKRQLQFNELTHINCPPFQSIHYYTPRTTKLLGGYTGFTPSVRPSVCPSVRLSVRPSRMPCPLCIIYSYGRILFILGTNDHYHERVCRVPWPLTLTYIFKVIRPWHRKSCPLCSIYSSGWILSIFSTNDHYH